MADGENHLGFMGPLLGRAKKVLFPDPDSCHIGHYSGSSVVTTSSRGSGRNPSAGERKKSKSRARRARLAATGSSLANISSRSAGGIVGSDSLKGCWGGGGGVDKENKLPSNSLLPANRRGKSQKMDSLAGIFFNESKDKLESNGASATYQSNSFSMRRGVGVNVHRRQNKCSLQCSISGCSGVNVTYKEKQHYQTAEVKFELGHRYGKEMADHNHALKKRDAYRLKRPSASSLMNGTKQSMKKSSIESVGNHRKGRRRGRCNHPISSLLVQDGASKAKSKRNSGHSSLMTLPSSTQKTQQTSPLNQAKGLRRKAFSKRATKNEAQTRNAANASNSVAEADIPSPDRTSVASLANQVKSLKIGGEPMNCSTPLTIRHRAPPGGIASPPGFLHRFSTLSSSNIFPVYSPTLDFNPKKRFDGKKTPENIIAAATARSMEMTPLASKTKTPDKMSAVATLITEEAAMTPLTSKTKTPEKKLEVATKRITEASPLATKMWISPNICRLDESNGLVENKRKTCAESNGSPGDSGHVGFSPRILTSFSSFISSPRKGGEKLDVARSNLFPSNDDEEKAITQKLSEREKHGPGSDVIEIEEPTPRSLKSVVEVNEVKKVCQGGSLLKEGDIKIASPITIKNDALSSAPSPTPDKEENVHTQNIDFPPSVDVEGDTKATEPRRSSRQSKPTDRLTITPWKRKKKKKGSKVRFDDSTNLDYLIDGLKEPANPPPYLEKGSADKDTYCVSKENVETSTSNISRALENWTSAENTEGCKSKDDLKTRCSVRKEINPTSMLNGKDAEATERNRSLSQSKPTDCLTAASWKKKKGREVISGNFASLDNTAEDPFEEKADTTPFLGLGNAQKDVWNVVSKNAECSISKNDNTLTENSTAVENSNSQSNDKLQTFRNESNPTSEVQWQDAEVTEPRKSSRQSKPTVRLTVNSWKRKTKKDGGVQSETSAYLDEPADYLVETKAKQLLPSLEQASAQIDEAVVSKEKGDSLISMNARPLEYPNAGENADGCHWSNEELKALPNESNPASALQWRDAEVTEPRKSSRQSKPTDRLTVTSWKRETEKYVEVQVETSAYFDEPADDPVKTKTKPLPPSLERACAKEDGPVVLKDNGVSSMSTNARTLENPNAGENADDCHWSNEEFKTLRDVQKEINPTSAFYWQEVAIKVGSKSSYECQSKWQSMVATPKVRKVTKKKNASPSKNSHNPSGVLHASMSIEEEDDDLFNSSPFRDVDQDDDNDMIATKFSNFGNSSSLSPYISQNTNPNNQREDQSALKFRRKGYNLYIDNLRKDINRVEKKKNDQNPNQITNSCTQIYADSWNGESQMTVKLLPDGTVKIKASPESFELDDDDMWGVEEEDEEE